MTNTLIVNAMISNMTSKGITPNSDQISDMQNIANSIIATIESATILYTTGLVDASGAVTGVFGNTIS